VPAAIGFADIPDATRHTMALEAAMTKRWTHRPEGSNWGDFGDDDQIGRLNWLTPAKVLEGIAEVREGRTFCLSLPLDYPGGNVLNPRRHPPRHFTPTRAGHPNFNYARVAEGTGLSDVMNDDAIVLYPQYSSQWDALAHVGSLFDADGDGTAERVYYNGFAGTTHMTGPAHDTGVEGFDRYQGVSATVLGIETMATTCVQGRGVLIDLHAHFGETGRKVGRADLERVMTKDGVTVEKGDMVLFHTGFARMLLGMGGAPDPARLRPNPFAELDGGDPALLQWITDSGVAALIADNYAIESETPTPPAARPDGLRPGLPLHEHCLFKLGVPLAELWHLSDLADWLRSRGRSRFLLTAPPLRLPGAVGSPVTPVATV
jgi:kynurenine formamidase